MVDGCSRFQAFLRVTFPLLAPGLVATGVFAFIQAWNEFSLAVVVMTREDKRTLPLWLSSFLDVNRGVDWGAIMAGSTLIAIPVIVFFLIVQGRMVSGLTSNAREPSSYVTGRGCRGAAVPCPDMRTGAARQHAHIRGEPAG